MRLRLVREPFDHPDYIFELKHDGFRALKLDIVTSHGGGFLYAPSASAKS